MNELIEKLISKKIKIGVYPISNNSWTDIGSLSEYKKIISNLN